MEVEMWFKISALLKAVTKTALCFYKYKYPQIYGLNMATFQVFQ